MIPKVSKAKRGLSYRTDRASNKDARSVFYGKYIYRSCLVCSRFKEGRQ